MKKTILTLATIGLGIALAFSSLSASPQAAPNKGRVGKVPEQHSDIKGAINSLQRAQAYLTLANHDFGGHRADALKAVEEAVKQLKLADQFDKK